MSQSHFFEVVLKPTRYVFSRKPMSHGSIELVKDLHELSGMGLGAEVPKVLPIGQRQWEPIDRVGEHDQKAEAYVRQHLQRSSG
jgi:hypothetical protein